MNTFLSRHKALAFSALVCILFVIFLAFGVHHLGKFHTADEDLWFANPTEGRVHKYWKALLSADWENTLINDKPGVSVAFVSGLGLLYDRDPTLKVIEKADHYRISDPIVNERTAFFFRLPVLIVSALLLIVIVFLVQRIFGYGVAIFFAIFAFLSPILIGMSQVVNPDSMLWTTTFVALLSYFLVVRDRNYRYLFLAIAGAGFALLSKYTSTFLLVFLLFFHICHVLFYVRAQSAKEWNQEIRRAIKIYALFLLGALSVFALFLPAAFVDPTLLYKNTFGFDNSKNIPIILTILGVGFVVLFVETYLLKNTFLYSLLPYIRRLLRPLFILTVSIFLFYAFIAVINWTFDNFLNLPGVTFDNERGHQFKERNFAMKFLYEIRPLIFTLTPLVLFFVFVEMIVWIRKSASIVTAPFAPMLITFIWLFYLAVVLQGLLVDVRYAIILYPIFTLIGALGAWRVVHWAQNKWPQWYAYSLIFGISLAIALSIASLSSAIPFYFNYTNRLLPLDNSVTTAWGYGGYEASQVLNALPNASTLVAWTDYEGFCNFFVGKCIKGTGIGHYNDGTYEGIDYYVVSRRGKQIQKKRWEGAQDRGAVEDEPIWELHILERSGNYIRIYKGRDPIPMIRENQGGGFDYEEEKEGV